MNRLIVFTQPDFFDGEAEQIVSLFDNGLTLLHLRKPHASKEEMVDMLKNIPQQYLSRVTLHDHFELVDMFPVGGVHLNSRNPRYSGSREVRLSKSCHSFDELTEISEYDYVTLSPIFDSISKQGYPSQFTHEDLLVHKSLLSNKVIALGGVTYENIGQLQPYGFAGAAMLGAIWKDFNIEKFKQCLLILNS